MTEANIDIHAVPHRRWLFWLALAISFLVFLFLIRSVLLPFILGIFTAYFLDPAADKLEKWGLSRTLSTVIITCCFFASFIAALIIVAPLIANQLSGLIETLPEYAARAEQQYGSLVSHWMGTLPVEADSVKSAVGNFSSIILKMAGELVAGVFLSGMALVNMLSLMLITPIVAFYLLRDWDNLVARLDTLLPRNNAATIREQLGLIDQTLAGFIRGQFNVCLIMGTFFAIGLSLAGLKFGILIGFATGLLLILPYVGFMFGMALGLASAYFQFGSFHDIWPVLAVFMAGQALESYFLTPNLVGNKVGLHPVWIIFGMLAGGALFGFVGVLLGVPLTAIIGVLIRFMLQKYLGSSYYQTAPTLIDAP